MTEKPFITSGRNTIIHKIRKLDLLVINGDDHPPIIVTYKGISGGFDVAKNAIDILQEKIYPKYKIICEPQMGKRGFYKKVFLKEKKLISDQYMDFLQYADGTNSLGEISKFIKLSFANTQKIFKTLLKKKLLTY